MSAHPTARQRRTVPPVLASLVVILLVLYFVATSVLAPPSARSDAEISTGAGEARRTVRAKAANAFVDSIGVNVHLHYNDTVYNRFDDLIEPRLRELGVHHIRDGAYTYDGVSADTFYYRRLRALGDAGIRANLLTSIDTAYTDRTDVDRLDEVQSWSGGAVELFEGVNEPDIAGVDDWVERTRSMQQQLWAKVQSDPALRDVEVIGPSPVSEPDALGDISRWVDYGNWHAYPGGRCPTCADAYGESFDSRVDDYRAPTGDKPLMLTETGYHNGAPDDHRPVSERASGRYIPRLLFEYFNRGVERSYLYELIDVRESDSRDDNFGLLRNDGSRKPAFVALRDLITLVDDPGPRFSPDTLAYALRGDTERVHQTLLQQQDGTFFLALWQERSSYDTGERANRPDAADVRGDITNPDQTVTVSFGRTFGDIQLHRPGRSAQPQRTWSDADTVTVDVPDEVVVLQLEPRNITAPPADVPRPGAEPPPADALPPDDGEVEVPRPGAEPPPDDALPPGGGEVGVPRPPDDLPPVAERPVDSPSPASDETSACAGVAPSTFRDVDASHPFAAEIACIQAWGITQGTGSGQRFEPSAGLPRWQMAVFLDRIATLENDQRGASADRTFRDVSDLSREARGAISRLRRKRVVEGTSRTHFSPHERVTRGQIASFIERLVTRSLPDAGPHPDRFSDDDGNVHEAAINAVAARGLVRGSDATHFRPNATVTRGATAAVLSRYLDLRLDRPAPGTR